MPKKMKFSVVLPIYINVELKTFRKSLQSILNQTLKPNEISVDQETIEMEKQNDEETMEQLEDIEIED